MLDAIEMEKRGIPTVTIAHEGFYDAARVYAETLGMPDLVIISQPTEGARNVPTDVADFAAATIDSVVAGLSASEPGDDSGDL